jgi:hypothetical protein
VLLSGVLITHQLSDEALGWFMEARGVVDELVAFVDEDRAAPDLDTKLRQLDARIISTRAPEFYKADFRAMVHACRGEWLLKIDYDEELSREWHDARWRTILDSDEFTHFWCPRRWTTASGNYIACEPWWPDRQLRLFRNRPNEITYPTRLHETMSVGGAGAYLRTLAIHHHDLRLASRSAREAKAESYERQRPGNGLGFFYLPEDYDLPQVPLPRASEFDPAREILRMDRLTDDDVAQLTLEVAPPPEKMAARQLLWLDVSLTNRSARSIVSGSPCAVNLAYHWLDAASLAPVVFDGERTAVLPELDASATAAFKMFIMAPPAPGDYLLRLALVQEHARWLDAAGSSTVQDFSVHITAT